MTETLAEDRAAALAALAENLTDDEREADIEAKELAQRTELEQRWAQLAPEALAGSEEAIAAQREVEAQLATLEHNAKLRRFAAAEERRREQEAADAEAEKQREAWRAEQAEAETRRDNSLRAFEKSIAVALESARSAIEANTEAAVLQGKIAPGSGMHYRRLNREVGPRIARLVRTHLHGWHVNVDGILLTHEGETALVAITPACAVCEHANRETIEHEREDGVSLRALSERHNVGRTTLSEHFRDHAEG